MTRTALKDQYRIVLTSLNTGRVLRVAVAPHSVEHIDEAWWTVDGMNRTLRTGGVTRYRLQQYRQGEWRTRTR